MYRYYFSITTAKEINDLRDSYGEEIRNAINDFNQSSQFARTYKKIIEESIKIYNDKFEFILETKDSLGDNLSLRYLHLLSKYLLDVDGLNNYNINKRFLKPLEIRSLQDDEKVEERELTDTQILKYIIDLYFENGNKRNKDFRNKIKEVIQEYINSGVTSMN